MVDHSVGNSLREMAECVNDWSCDEDLSDHLFFLPPPPIPAFLEEELGLGDLDNLEQGESGQHPLSTVDGNAPNDFCHFCKWADPSYDNWTINGGGSSADDAGNEKFVSILIIVAVISMILGAALVVCLLRCKKGQNGTGSKSWFSFFTARGRTAAASSRRNVSEQDSSGNRPKGGVSTGGGGFSLKFCNHRRTRNPDTTNPGSPEDFQSYSEGPYSASGATYAELNTYCEIPDRSGLSSAYGNVEDQGSNPSSAYYSDASVNSHRGRHSPSQASVEVATICGGNHHHHHGGHPQPGMGGHHPPHELLTLGGFRAPPGLQLPVHPHQQRAMTHHHHWFSAPRGPANVCNCGRLRGGRIPPQQAPRSWMNPMGDKSGRPHPNGPPPSPPPPPLPMQRSYPHLMELHMHHHHPHQRMVPQPSGDELGDFAIRRPSQRQPHHETDVFPSTSNNDQMNGSGSDSGIVVGAAGQMSSNGQHMPQPSSPASTGTESSFLLNTGQNQDPSPRGVRNLDVFDPTANRQMTVINQSCVCPNHIHMIDSQHQLGNVHLDRRCLSFVPSEYI